MIESGEAGSLIIAAAVVGLNATALALGGWWLYAVSRCALTRVLGTLALLREGNER